MRLHSVTLRNYRIHRHLTVNFDPERTLIGGSNESGKSTLVEAVHRALFLKARVTGDAHRTMISIDHSGHPEVEIIFETDGDTYKVIKRFSGNTGTTQLTRMGGQTFQGEEAESQLSQLLKVDELSGGRGLAERINQQWAHLWVWQGKSSADPAGDANAQQQALIQRLQSVGGAMVLQSTLDQRVAEYFTAQVNDIFTSTGRIKQGSSLERATTARDVAKEKLRQRRERLQQLDTAIYDFESAIVILNETSDSLQQLNVEYAEIQQKQQRVTQLRQQEQVQQAVVDKVGQTYESLRETETQIDTYRSQIASLAETLKPRQSELNTKKLEFEQMKEAGKTSAANLQQAADAVRAARCRQELGEALLQHIDKRQRLVELEKQEQEVKRLQSERERHCMVLTRLPKITQNDIDALNDLYHRQQQAETALQAMAAGIEVISADQAVTIGGNLLTAGQTQVVTEMAEITVGSYLRLRIHPGGGNALASAREAVAAAKQTFADRLQALGIKIRDEAAITLAERTRLDQLIANIDAQLCGMKADKLPQQQDEARALANEAYAELQRRSDALLPTENLPASPDEASHWACALKTRLNEAERTEAIQKQLHDQQLQQRDALASAIEQLREALQKDEDEKLKLEALLNEQLKQFGLDNDRAARLKTARDEKTYQDEALQRICNDLAQLQPDLLEVDTKRLIRAIDNIHVQRQQAETKKAVAEAALRSDGHDDPVAALALAQAEYDRAVAQQQAVARQADSIQLLTRLFQEEQQQLIDRYTQPLADKITGYLQCLFGPDTRAQVAWNNNALTGIQLVRGQQSAALDFATLSSGAREQVAAAVRLAVAEVLAADHGGSLPVVFDDAFAYADPSRVKTLQRMLDLAATRGLQVILLSCNPTDYATLGAKTTLLRPSADVVAENSRSPTMVAVGPRLIHAR